MTRMTVGGKAGSFLVADGGFLQMCLSNYNNKILGQIITIKTTSVFYKLSKKIKSVVFLFQVPVNIML